LIFPLTIEIKKHDYIRNTVNLAIIIVALEKDIPQTLSVLGSIQ